MKYRKNLILVFAIIGVCAIAYGGWRVYQRKSAEDQARSFFAAPPSKGLPDLLHASPAPPPQ